MTPIVPPSPLTLRPTELEQCPGPHGGLGGVPEHNPVRELERQDGVVDESKSVTPPPSSSSRRRKPSQKAHGLRVSDKKNLIPSQMPAVADRLINSDVVSYLLSNCRLVYGRWVSYLDQQPCGPDGTVETSIVAALHRVQGLLEDKRTSRLLLRFACLQLTWEIDAYKTVAATDRIQGKAKRSPGQRDSTIAIDLYLAMKQRVSKKVRRDLSTHCRTRRRWFALAGRSPFLIFFFPAIADTLVYVAIRLPLSETHGFERQNNSITESTLKALVHLIEQKHPGLVQVLNEVGAYTGLFSSGITPTRPCAEDFVLRIHQLFSSIRQTISLESDTTVAGI